jgi:hypothetical protein
MAANVARHEFVVLTDIDDLMGGQFTGRQPASEFVRVDRGDHGARLGP